MQTSATTTTPQPEVVRSEALGFRGRFIPTDDPNVLVGETWVSPGGGAGPLHRHLHQSERFEVESGAITVRLGRTRHVVPAGGTFFVPKGASHTFVNHTAEEAHIRTTFSPPMRLEGFFTELLAGGGKPTLKESARLMGEYPEEFFYLAGVPVRVQRALGAVVRALTRG